MKKKLGDMSLKYKATWLLLVVSLLPLFVLGTCIVTMYSNAIKERSRLHIDENIRMMTSRISGVFTNADLCGNHIVLNLNQIENSNIRQQLVKDNSIQSLLNQSVLIFDGVESIVFLTEDSRMYSTNVNLLKRKEEIEESSYREQLIGANGRTRLFDRTDSCMEIDGEVVTMGKRVIHIVSGETIGYLFVNIPSDYLVQSMKNSISDYMVYDNLGSSIVEHGDTLLAGDKELGELLYNKEEVFEHSYNGETYLIARSEVPEYHWKIIGMTSLNKFNVSGKELLGIGFVVACVIIALTAVVIYFATALVTKPLLILKKGAEEISSGNLDIQFSFQTEDEIGKLGRIFNKMTLKIRELLSRVDEEAKKKREYELALLHEQIKPHFLYNTLDIIIVLIEMKREWDASHVAKKLADYYKNSLSSSEEIIPLGREIQLIEDYLELQNIRYGEKFSYTIEVPEEVKAESVPKLTLQPLVENAIYHGLKYKDEWGTISVKASLEDEMLVLYVTDAGIGIPKDRIEEVVALTETPKQHFGLYSVMHRLHLYYGNNAKMTIESTYGEGTSIKIEIPRG